MKGGLLVVDKPAGPTSHEVVAAVRAAFGAAKAGHAGTLDPTATGVLAVCVGDAVKLQQYLTDGDKAYLATVAFGTSTTTEDGEGEVVERGDPAAVTEAALRAALPGLVGELDQVPPMYSAVRVGGRRLFEAARAGEEVDRTPRRVTVHALELVELAPAPADGHLVAKLAVRCGKGTYVRTLAAELGRRIGVPAHLAGLRRTEASGFDLSAAIPLEEALALGRTDPAALRRRLVPAGEALRLLPAVPVDAGEAQDLWCGRFLRRPVPPGPLLRALLPDGTLVAILKPISGGGARPVRGFPPEPPPGG
ncbi:MAG: tRNA pseudouridine(55) synthase TruB [Anaeromyxobacter sp.]